MPYVSLCKGPGSNKVEGQACKLVLRDAAMPGVRGDHVHGLRRVLLPRTTHQEVRRVPHVPHLLEAWGPDRLVDHDMHATVHRMKYGRRPGKAVLQLLEGGQAPEERWEDRGIEGRLRKTTRIDLEGFQEPVPLLRSPQDLQSLCHTLQIIDVSHTPGSRQLFLRLHEEGGGESTDQGVASQCPRLPLGLRALGLEHVLVLAEQRWIRPR